jgi:hypothetical protein
MLGFWKIVLFQFLKLRSVIAEIYRISFSHFLINLSSSPVVITTTIISTQSHFAVYMWLNIHNLFTIIEINATEVEDYELAQEHGFSIVTMNFKDRSSAGFMIM